MSEHLHGVWQTKTTTRERHWCRLVQWNTRIATCESCGWVSAIMPTPTDAVEAGLAHGREARGET